MPIGEATTRSECFRGIQQDSDWPFVHEFDLHHFLEAAGFAAKARSLNLLHEEFVEAPCVVWGCSGVERWTLASPRVAEQSELRDCKDTASHVLHAAIHLAVVVFEDAESGDLLGQVRCVRVGILMRDSEQDEQTQADFATGPIVDRDFGSAYALDHRSHFVKG